jgi:CDP-Glycerol:Poly(glycerophosphate) glycerophosphotransferase
VTTTDSQPSGCDTAEFPRIARRQWPRMRWARATLTRLDTLSRQLTGRRTVLFDVRTPMNFAILAPICRQLQLDPRVAVVFTAARPEDIAGALREMRVPVHPRRALKWRRVDLCITADPWDPILLRRCRRRANFFHGTAGKYDLDSPGRLPIGFELYDRVAFINADRMSSYVTNAIVSRQAAVLVGFPKVDALVNGKYDAAAVREALHLERDRPTAIYAPTFSTASSLHIAGEAITRNLIDTGFNVIVKLHDRSLDVAYSGGIDWRARFAAIAVPNRIAFVEIADSSPLLAASDVMITDHSSVGFEYCLVDRPLIVFDAPDLPRIARINPEKIAMLRSAARVVSSASEVGAAAVDELAHCDRRRDARRAIARDLFYKAGTATPRAMALVYELLELRPPSPSEAERRSANVPASLAASLTFMHPERAHQAHGLQNAGRDA